MAQSHNFDIAASLTPTVGKCERKTCQKVLPSDQLKLIRSKYSSTADRLYCPSCLQHVLGKGGTIVRRMDGQDTSGSSTHQSKMTGTPPVHMGISLNRPNVQGGFISSGAPLSQVHIRQQVNAAQRSTTSVPVLAMGQPSNSISLSYSPNVAIPGHSNYTPTAGYTEQHRYFEQDLKKGQMRAKSLQSTNEPLLKVTVKMKTITEGKNGPIHSQFGPKCAIGLSQVPLHVGVEELKNLICDKFDEKEENTFKGWSGLTLDRTYVWLEYADSSGRVESACKDIDIDAIKHRFFTEKTQKFKSQMVLKLHLMLAGVYCEEIKNYFDRKDFSSRNIYLDSDSPSHDKLPIKAYAVLDITQGTQGRVPNSVSNINVLPQPVTSTPSVLASASGKLSNSSSSLKRQRYVKTEVTATTSIDLTSPGSSPERPAKKMPREAHQVAQPDLVMTHAGAITDPVISKSGFSGSCAILPDPAILHTALTLQLPLSKERVRSTIGDAKYHNMVFYLPRKSCELNDLLLVPIIDPKDRERMEGTLSVYLAENIGTPGAFKISHPGSLSFTGSTAESTIGQLPVNKPICVKQLYVRNSITGQARNFYNGAKELRDLFQELVVIEWASALMDFTYNWIRLKEAEGIKSILEIPKLRFVHCALGRGTSADGHKTFFIEELIDSEKDGAFIKYISNASGTILASVPEDRIYISKFLSFAQHQQYDMTDRLVFISDFQGGHSLLTDPQILTNPTVGNQVFGQGNVDHGFFQFHKTHACNAFCRFYGLSPPQPPSSIPPVFEKLAESESTIPGLDHIHI